MLITEQRKVHIVYISALLLIAALIAGALIYTGAANRRLRTGEDAIRFDVALHLARARSDAAAPIAALEEQRDKFEGYAAQLELRLAQRREELLLLVNPWNTVPEDYRVHLAETKYGFLVDVRCLAALENMLDDCAAAGYWPQILSAYRTQDYQQMLYDNKVKRVMAEGVYTYEQALTEAAAVVALPGTSEHQLGLAVDIVQFGTNLDVWQQYTYTQQWLMENCRYYGFILRYPVGSSEITGIVYEPWHYRYVGCETAAAVYDMGCTFEEYLESIGG